MDDTQKTAPTAPVAPTSTAPAQGADLQQLSEELKNLAAAAAAQSAPAPTPAEAAPAPEASVPAAPEAPAPAAPAPIVTEEKKEEVAAQPAPSVPAVAETSSMGQKVIVYTTATCPFSKAEKEYLTKKGIGFTEKDVEKNEADLREMLTISDNFAGVPVTHVQNAKGEKLIVKGFTEADFEEELVKMGMVQASEKKEEAVAAPAPTVAPAETPAAPAPTAAPVETPAAPAAPQEMPKIPDLT